MIPHWPASLPQVPRRQSWVGGPIDTRATFRTEVGPPIQRRRVTGTTRKFNAVFLNLTAAQRVAFDDFFDAALHGGTKAYAWRDPVALDLALWRINSDGDQAYSFAVRVADRSDLSLSLIRLPGTPWWAAYARPDSNRVPFVVADYANAVFGVAGLRTAPSAVAAVAGTFDLYTTDGATTEALGATVTAGSIPATAPGTVTRIVGFIP